MLLLLSPLPSYAESPTPMKEIRGEVLMVTAELIVVKSADGTSILIPLGKDSPLDASVKAGDRVEVLTTQDHQVRSVKKLTERAP